MGGTKGVSGWLRKHKLAVGMIGVIVILGGVFGYIYLAPYFEDEAGTTSTSNLSTFVTKSRVDLEDVSDFQDLSIWVPKDNDEIKDLEDVCTLSLFEKEVTAKDAEDISLDLSIYPYVWVEMIANSVFANRFILLTGVTNRQFDLYAYHQSSDVNFNILDSLTMGAITVGTYQTNANLTGVINIPGVTKTDCHYGDSWDISTTDFTDMTLSEQKEIWDEADYRGQFPIYDPQVDIEKELDNPLEQLTNAFALKFTFNDTVSTVDSSVLQVNCTIPSAYPIDVVYSSTLIYFIFYEELLFNNGPYDFDFEMNFAANISISNVHSGRLVVPRGDDSLGAFSAYSAIGA